MLSGERSSHADAAVDARRTLASMSDWLAVAGRVAARPLTADDECEYLARVRASAALHRGWVARPSTSAAFAEMLTRCAQDHVHAFVLVRREDGAFVGAANLTQIDNDPLSSAWIAFNAFAPYERRGYMTDGLHAVLRHAFGTLGLQRLEAEVQPANARSRALLTRVGFRHERCVSRSVKTGGPWRDYERWAIQPQPPASSAERTRPGSVT